VFVIYWIAGERVLCVSGTGLWARNLCVLGTGSCARETCVNYWIKSMF